MPALVVRTGTSVEFRPIVWKLYSRTGSALVRVHIGVRGSPERDISSLGAMGPGPGRFLGVVRASHALFGVSLVRRVGTRRVGMRLGGDSTHVILSPNRLDKHRALKQAQSIETSTEH